MSTDPMIAQWRALAQRGRCLVAASFGGRREAAEAAMLRATALAPTDAVAWRRLGEVIPSQQPDRALRAFDAAEAILRRALVQRPNDVGLIYNLGVLRKDTDRPEQAVKLFERALLLSTEDPEYRWDRSLALLQAGDYVRGFEAYESRWGLKRAAKRKISLPRWDGSPLKGRSLFLSDEQRFGDVLQWARFVAPLKKMGAGRIVMECQPELMRLMSLLPEVDEIVPRAKVVPDCDLTLPLLSLPHVFGTTLDTLPNTVPYLRAPETEHRLPEDGRLKPGLVWAGKPTPRDRSVRRAFTATIKVIRSLSRGRGGRRGIVFRNSRRSDRPCQERDEALVIGPSGG